MKFSYILNARIPGELKFNSREEYSDAVDQVKLIEEILTPAQKLEIITSLTDAMVKIEGENMRPVTWVIIEEVRRGEWELAARQ